MDVHIRRAVTSALRLRSVDVLTAQEDGAAELDDDRLMQRATELGRVSRLARRGSPPRVSPSAEGGHALFRYHLRAPASGHGWPDGGRS